VRYVPVLLALGAAIYLVIWYLQSRSRPGRGAPWSRTPPRPRAPDDDAEFLAELDRRRRREAREAAQAAAGADARPGTTPPGGPGGAVPPGRTTSPPAGATDAGSRTEDAGRDEPGAGGKEPARDEDAAHDADDTGR
jgi:hypothetical protein